jgi:hypothetical protein
MSGYHFKSQLGRVYIQTSADPSEYLGPVPTHLLVDRDPCPRCGARRDLGCGHGTRFIGERMSL